MNGGSSQVMRWEKDYLILYSLYVEHSRLDPNDPRNAKLLQLIESIPTSEQTNYFRLVSVDDVQRYISDEELFCDKRFTMLYMRDQGVRIKNYCNNS